MERKRSDDDIIGVRHGGGRDQYGGSFAAGQSGSGAYANPHTRGGGGDAGNAMPDTLAKRIQKPRQSGQGYTSGGQFGSRNLGNSDHSAASTASDPAAGDRSYADHPSQQQGTPERAHFDAALEGYEQDGLGTHRPLGDKVDKVKRVTGGG